MNSTSTSEGGWPASEMRTYVNEDIYNSLPSELQNAIIETKVISSHTKYDLNNNFESEDRLYLLSGEEIFEGYSSGYDTSVGTSRQLDYYKISCVTNSGSENTVKKINNLAYDWWLRNPNSYYTPFFHIVYSTGTWHYTSKDSGVAPAFRLAI